MPFGESVPRSCPVCGTESAGVVRTQRRVNVDCQRCGLFFLTEEVLEDLPAEVGRYAHRNRLAASSWLREHAGSMVSIDDLQKLFLLTYPTVGERAEKLLIALSQSMDEIGSERTLVFNGDADYDLQAYSWSANGTELRYLMADYLVEEKGWLRSAGDPTFGGFHRYLITPKGHDFLDSLRRGSIKSANGFCAMWFDDSVNSVWAEAISPAIAAAGYAPTRIDEVEHVNRIDDEILAQIRRSKFVVSDFTGQRNGVYFEAGFALGLGLPVIWTIREDSLDEVHFDNRQYNFLRWNPEDLPGFRAALMARIVALFGEGPHDTNTPELGL
jgi:hypothetical protein